MRLLIDQDVYAITISVLKASGHDVIRCSELGLAKASDIVILERANDLGRVLVTRDRDFGTLVFAKQIVSGVIYLRILPSTLAAVHSELARVLARYSENELLRAFVVIAPGGHRIRRLLA